MIHLIELLTHYISWQSVVVRGDRTRLSVVSCLFMPYLVEELHQSSAVEPRQHLRSASTSLLVVQQKKSQPSAIELFRSLLPDCGTLCH